MYALITPYLRFLRQPDVGKLFAIAALTRLPISMTALGLTLYLRQQLGDFAQAGLVVGVYYVAIAAVSPLLGRWIDRKGPQLPLLITGWLQPLQLLLVLLAAQWQWGITAVLGFALLAGLLPPPLTTIMRTLWRHRFPDEQQRRMAYALDSVITELGFTLGPAVIAVLVALTNARLALLVAILGNFLAFLLFWYARVLAIWPKETHGERHWLGPLRDGKLLLYFALAFGLSVCLGLFEVCYPAYALAQASPLLAGALLALNGIGSALGGVLYGAWSSQRSTEQQFALALTVLIAPFVLHALLPQLFFYIVVAFLGGLAVAPALTSLTLVTNRRAPAVYATEAVTWSTTFIVSGFGAGIAAAGYFVEAWSVTATFWLGALVVASMALCAWALQREPLHV